MSTAAASIVPRSSSRAPASANTSNRYAVHCGGLHPRAIASLTETASRAAATSCTRTTSIPAAIAKALMATVPYTRSCGSRPVSLPIVDFAMRPIASENRVRSAAAAPRAPGDSARRSFQSRCRGRVGYAPARCRCAERVRAFFQIAQDGVNNRTVVVRPVLIVHERPAASRVPPRLPKLRRSAPHAVHDVRARFVRGPHDRRVERIDRDGRVGSASRAAAIAETTRSRSIAASTGSCPGRVDCPPKSRISLPARHCSSA